MNPSHPAYSKGRAGGLHLTGAGVFFAEEEADFAACGFCGEGGFTRVTAKLDHLEAAHGVTERTPGCEPHAQVFASQADFEEHRASQHSE